MPHNAFSSTTAQEPQRTAATLALQSFVAIVAGLTLGLILAYGITAAASHEVFGAERLPGRSQNLIGFLTRAVDASLPLGLLTDTAVAPPFAHENTPRREAVMPVSPSASSAKSQQLLSPDWSVPRNVSNSSDRSTNPVVLAGSGEVVHVLWEEDERIFHAIREGNTWRSLRRLATGFQPAAALTSDGVVHMVYSNEFAGQFNVFYVRWDQGTWTLPRMVSKTTGTSAHPAVVIDGLGVVHAAWADTTPGFSILYHGWLEETWLNEPLHNARGTSPQLAYDQVHSLFRLAYQATPIGSGARDIFYLEGTRYQWSLPENISRSAGAESLSPSMAIDGVGVSHMVWQEQEDVDGHVRYARGTRGNWSQTERISSVGTNVREPKVVVTHGTQLSVVWREGNTVQYRRRAETSGHWGEATPLVENTNGLGNLDLTGAPSGELHLVWGGWSPTSDRDVYHSRRDPLLGSKVFLPGITIDSS